MAAVGQEELVTVGRVGRAHGLDGHFVVERPSEDPGRFELGARVLAGGEEAEIVSAKRVGGGRLAIKLDKDVERGAVLEVPRSQLPPPAEDEYYVADLVGLEVIEDGGRKLGRVRDVYTGVANDALELETGTLLPLVEDCVLEIDVAAGRILVAEGFAE